MGSEGFELWDNEFCRFMMDESDQVRTYRDLKVWQLGMEICTEVYAISRLFPDEARFGLTSQIRRASASVPANIAEGHARSSTRDYLRYLGISLGSLAELSTFVELAGRMNLANVAVLREIYKMIEEERRMLRGLCKALRARLGKS